MKTFHRHLALSVFTAAGLVLIVTPTAPGGSFVLQSNSPSALPYTHILYDETSASGSIPFNIGISMADLGLHPLDKITSISNGKDLDLLAEGHAHLFSVRRCSLGMPGSGVEHERLVGTSPGGIPEHAADLFLWPMPGMNELAPAGYGWAEGTTTGDEANAGLVTTGIGDNVNGYEIDSMVVAPGAGVLFEVFFTLAPGSPTLATYGWSPLDILAAGGSFGIPATPRRYLSRAELGLMSVADDRRIDALSLSTIPNPNENNWPLFQAVEFSLRSACNSISETLSSGDIVMSGADIIASDGIGLSWIAHVAADLDLQLDDDVNALETIEELETNPCAAADLDGDGSVGTSDMLQLLACWGGYSPCPPYQPCDLNQDCTVDTTDFLQLLGCWGPV